MDVNSITKQSLRIFLDEHPSLSLRKLSEEAKLHPNAINQLYNGCNRNLTSKMIDKLLPILKKYGYLDNY